MSLSKTESYSRTHLNASAESQISESVYRILRTEVRLAPLNRFKPSSKIFY